MPATRSDTVVRSNIFFAEKDQALRDDVRRLGRLVGDVVREQGGEALFDVVETARLAAIAHREGDQAAIAELHTLLGQLSPRTSRDLIRAFSTYFQMVNMAEKVHRIRRRRAYLQDEKTPQPFGFIDTLKRLHASGIELDGVEQIVANVGVEPVFTAHPTEATRRTLLRKQQSIARLLVSMLDPYMTPPEVSAALGQIRLEMTTGWQTEEHPDERALGDDAEHILFFLTEVLYRMIPPLYESFESALASIYGKVSRSLRLPIMVRFGTWVGGDMDADLTVTAKSIRESLYRQKSLILNLYYRECTELAERLSQSESRVGVADALRERTKLYAGHFPKAAHSVPGRYRKMPYRVFLRLVCARLQATYDDAAFPYESPDELQADIELIADSLRANRGLHAGLFAVKRLLRRIRTFGFHIAQLDIRQHALIHRRVIGEGLAVPGWLDRTPEERSARLTEALERRESPLGKLTSEARRTLAVFQTIAHCRRKYGIEAIGAYIVSMAHGPDDVLSVLLLAKWGLLGPKGGDVPLDIVPLFETVDDLENAAQIMIGLLNEPAYRSHLKARGDRQMVMIGYSDSSRDGGAVAASWSLHKAQQALVATLHGFGVQLTLFHGRGAPLGSGARLTDAVLAAPPGAVSRQLRMTEQGEMINARYGLRGIAMRTLEQALSALIWVQAMPPRQQPESEQWQQIMQEIADESRRAYRRLVYSHEDFLEYFRLATPIDVIERPGWGTPPAAGDDHPRAVARSASWEFAWTQNRCLLPDWFGFAAGVTLALDRHGETVLKDMFERWPFIRMLLADVELALAKADLDIAERYSMLAGELHGKFFPAIRNEYERAVEVVLRLRSQERLLEHRPTLRRAIRLRNPYVDPMSFLQVDLLARWRKADRLDDEVLQALRSSIKGIAHGMQNTA